MKYHCLKIRFMPDEEIARDILSAVLGEHGFESFEYKDGVLNAYCPDFGYDAVTISDVIGHFLIDYMKVNVTVEDVVIEDRDWNEEWERTGNTAMVVDNKVVIHAPGMATECVYEYDIVIDPKMSFGTGHHETTRMMIREVLKTDVSGKRVADVGCGTAVLGILCSLRGAKEVTAIDIDEWAKRNAEENAEMNKCNNIKVELGTAKALEDNEFDVILANINRNVLIGDMEDYARGLKKGGRLVMSGFLKNDVKMITEKAREYGLRFEDEGYDGDWARVVVTKQDSQTKHIQKQIIRK